MTGMAVPRGIGFLLLALTAFSCCQVCSPPADEGVSYEAATFEIDGDAASMYGVIDHTTPDVVRALVNQHPDVKRIVLVDVPGSDNDPANLAASRLVREHGFTTVVPTNGVIASGGVDFFLAGAKRIVEPCGKLGVHSWDDDGPDGGVILGNEVSRDHPMHTMFLEFYREMGIPEEFYWFTLEAASPQRMYWLNDEEILRFGLVTPDVP